MDWLSRLGTGMVCGLILGGCGYPALPPAPAVPVPVTDRGFGVLVDKPAAGGALDTAERLTEMQLLLVQAFRAIKAGDGGQAIDLLTGAKRVAGGIDPERLSAGQQDKITNLTQFLRDYDKENVLAALKKVVANDDPSDLATKAQVLLALKHFYAMGKAVVAKDMESALRELKLAQRAFADIDFDRIEEGQREKLLPIKRRIDTWARLAGLERAD